MYMLRSFFSNPLPSQSLIHHHQELGFYTLTSVLPFLFFTFSVSVYQFFPPPFCSAPETPTSSKNHNSRKKRWKEKRVKARPAAIYPNLYMHPSNHQPSPEQTLGSGLECVLDALSSQPCPSRVQVFKNDYISFLLEMHLFDTRVKEGSRVLRLSHQRGEEKKW